MWTRLSLILFLSFLLTVDSKRLPNGSHRSISRFDNSDADYSPEEVEVTTKKTLVATTGVKGKDGGGKNILTIGEKTNLLTDLIDLITTGLRNFSINDAIAIGVFILAIAGIKAVVIGILIWIWVAAEKHGDKGGYSNPGGYGSPPQISYGYDTPSPAYGNPVPSYGAPSTSYGSSPSSTYHKPATNYGTPAVAYGTPSNSYGTPAVAYGTPSSSYGSPSTDYGTPSVAAYTSSSSSRSFTNDFDQIAGWILKSVTNYILASNNNKSVNQT